MVHRTARAIGTNTVFLFGPQALSFDEGAFRHLRSTILRTEEYSWILDVIAELATDLESFAKQNPKLTTWSRSRLSLLDDFDRWFNVGSMPPVSPDLPNFLVSPLVVVKQLVQYAEYRKTSGTSHGIEAELHNLSKHNEETLGFCTGFLSALAVSCSTDKESFARYGAVAIRLSMLIGAIVDAQNETEEGVLSKSLATIWHSADEKDKMSDILSRYPDVSLDFVHPSSYSLANLARRLTSLYSTMRAGQL